MNNGNLSSSTLPPCHYSLWQVTIGKNYTSSSAGKFTPTLAQFKDPHLGGEGRPPQAVLGPTAHGHQHSQPLEPPVEQLLQEVPQWHIRPAIRSSCLAIANW